MKKPCRARRGIPGLVRVMLCCAAAGGWACAASVPAPAPTEVPSATAQAMDRWCNGLNEQMQQVTRNLDAFFKRDDAPAAATNSTARIRLSLRLKDGAGLSPNIAASAKLALPHAEERLQLFADNLRRDILPSDEHQSYDDSSMQLGARLWLLREVRSRLHLEGGLRFHGLPDPFTQLEFEYEHKLDGWVGRFSQDGYYFTQEGFGELSEVDVERRFKDKSIFRSTTAAGYSQQTHGVEFEQSFYYDMPLPGHCRSLIPGAGVLAHKCGPFLMDNYIANLTYRACFYRPWLMFEITPQIEFPSGRNYAPTPSIRVGFEIWLGSLPEDR